MGKNLSIAFLLLLTIYTRAQQSIPSPAYKLIAGKNIIAAKNYYLLTLLQEDKAARQLLESDPALSQLLQQKKQQLSQSLTECKNDIACFAAALNFSDDEIKTVAARLSELYADNNALGKLVKTHLIPSGCYILFQQLPAKEMLAKAWEQDANGINFLIGVYAEGKKPNYPKIDSIAFNVGSMGYSWFMHSVNYLVMNESLNDKLFFLPSLTAALHLLEVNEREQAEDYEPMALGENKAAFDRIKTIKWDAYKYSLIMIPGAGPEEPTVALSAEGMIRCRLAALQYQKGIAPFIVTSGGKVHPYKTKYCEAIEMKKYLVEKLHIPANAVFIDPHARHTTTNMRNTVRLIYRYGMPMSKPAITCTTRGQSLMIESTLIARCMKELNEAPYKNGKRLSETEMEFYPLPEALQINPAEPMDP
ncbi:MAG: YdcF family protein [Chitinophagaceae bacterium]